MAANLFILFLALVAIQSAYSARSISFRWCATKVEMDKCHQFIQYVNKTAQNKSLPLKVLSCVKGESYDDCATKIKESKADLVTLDGGRVYAAGKNNGLVPIVAEIYGLYKQKYYAVAVVKKNNTGFGLKQLKGKKSCHTGARKTAGWNVPIGYMLREKIIPSVKCNTANHDFYSAANFFNQSCVPGVKSIIKTEEVADKLCALCDGPGPDKCSENPSQNKYYDYHGAFKCMADGKGDVAFVKHATTKEVVTKDPGKYGAVSDYKYLCKDGKRKDIGQHEQCFLGFNPAHAVVTRADNYLDDIVTILTAMSSMYGSNQTDWTKFQLFNSTKYGGANLLFKDSSTELVGISKDKRTYKGYLGDDYVKDIEALNTCDTSASTKEPTSVSIKTTPYAVIVLFVALLAML